MTPALAKISKTVFRVLLGDPGREALIQFINHKRHFSPMLPAVSILQEQQHIADFVQLLDFVSEFRPIRNAKTAPPVMKQEIDQLVIITDDCRAVREVAERVEK